MSFLSADIETQERCASDVREAHDLLATRQPELEAASSPEAYAHALRSARIPVQKIEMDQSESFFIRDVFMAENAAWLLEQSGPDAKIVLWAHNGHVNTREEWMGTHLRREYGDDLVVVGFDFFQGSFNARGLSEADVVVELQRPRFLGPPPFDTYEHHFESAGLPRFVVDLRGVDPGTPATSWLAGPRRFRLIGAAVRPDDPLAHFIEARLPSEFDLMIYFRDTTPSMLLPFNPPSVF